MRASGSTPSSRRSGPAATGATARTGRAAPRPTIPGVPEAPQMQALAERIEGWLGGAVFEGYEPLGFSGLKTYEPPPDALVGAQLERVDRRAENWVVWVVKGGRRRVPL